MSKVETASASKQANAAASREVALWASAWARLLARKWLLLVAGAVLAILVFAAGLQWLPAVLGFAAVMLAAAAVPLEGRLHPAVARTAATAGSAARLADVDDLLQAIPDPAVLLGGTGTVLHFNRKAADHYPALRAGTRISATIRHPEVLEAVGAIAADEAPVTVVFTERVPVERRMSASLARLRRAPGGRPDAASVLLCLRDLTEQERINQMRTDFIANASHELRTPLASLAGFIETLQGAAREDADARDRFLDIMGQQAARMSRLIDDLLSLSRVEMNVHLLPTERVDVGETVRYVAHTLDPLARESRVEVALDAPPGPTFVQGDRDELVQVFQNLIQNALKYARPGDHVGVRISRDEPRGDATARIGVSVADTGPGIAPEHLPRLTERFYRVDVGASRRKGGTGLGLAIVKHVVNRHRGELKISSEPGKGSTFTVVLREAAPQGATADRDATG